MIRSFLDSEYRFIASLYGEDVDEEELLESDNVESKEEVTQETSSDESSSSSTWSCVLKIGLTVAAIFAAYKLGSYVKNLSDVRAEVLSSTDASEFSSLPLNRQGFNDELVKITDPDTSSMKAIASLKKLDKKIQRKAVLSEIVVDCGLYVPFKMVEKAKALMPLITKAEEEVDSKTRKLFEGLHRAGLIRGSDIWRVSPEDLQGLLSQNSHLWVKESHLKYVNEFKKVLPDLDYFIEEVSILQRQVCEILKSITMQKDHEIPENFLWRLNRLSEFEKNATTFVEVMSEIAKKTDELMKKYG